MPGVPEGVIDPELIGVKLKNGSIAYLRPSAVLGLVPTEEEGMKLLLQGGMTVALHGSGGTLRRKLLGLPEPEPAKAG